MNALVVGAGEMGRWVGDVLRSDLGRDVDVAFADTERSAATAAAADAASDVVDDPDDAMADLVCIAVPIPAAVEAIETWASVAEAAVVDVTGTMADPVDAMRETAPDCERASFHPLFAPANEPGNVAVVIDERGPHVDELQAAFQVRGNDLYETTPEEHDEAMRTVQARTHATVLAYALSAEPVPDALHTPISAGLEELVAQVTDGDARVYSDIQEAFEGADDVADAARRIAEADAETFARLYEDAGE